MLFLSSFVGGRCQTGFYLVPRDLWKQLGACVRKVSRCWTTRASGALGPFPWGILHPLTSRRDLLCTGHGEVQRTDPHQGQGPGHLGGCGCPAGHPGPMPALRTLTSNPQGTLGVVTRSFFGKKDWSSHNRMAQASPSRAARGGGKM